MKRAVKTKMGRLACVAVAAGGVVLASAGPAAAHNHTYDIYNGIARQGSVTISNSHRTISVCDRLADNIGVWVEFYEHHAGSDDRYRTLRDENGSQSGCGVYTSSGADYITILRGHSRNGGLIGNSPAWFPA